MIILNGHHKNLSKLVFIFIISLIFCSNAEEIKVAPLISLDEIEPSYDEDFLSSNEERQSFESAQKENDDNNSNDPVVEISILNKITADVDRVKILLKENYFYKELKIYAIDCYVSGPYEKNEIGIYLNIHNRDSKEKIFNGWMLKTLPSISSMEHPIYDIWVEDCA